MGGGVHIDFNLDFLSAEPAFAGISNRNIFGAHRAALPGALPMWYARFRLGAQYQVGHIAIYYSDDLDLLSREERPTPSSTNLYVCVDGNNAGDFNPPSSSSWKSMEELNITHHTGVRLVSRNDFINGSGNAVNENEICLNLFEFINMPFIVCNATFLPRDKNGAAIALRPTGGASMGGGVVRTKKPSPNLDDGIGFDRLAVNYPEFAISGVGKTPLPSKEFGFASTSLNAHLGANTNIIDATNSPTDPNIDAQVFNSSEVYSVGDFVNYFQPIVSGQIDTTSIPSNWDESFDSTEHPRLAVCIKNTETPARDASGNYDFDKIPWNNASSFWRDYASSTNRPNSSLSSIYDYLVNKQATHRGFQVDSSSVSKNLANESIIPTKARIRMNDFGGGSNIYGHLMAKWGNKLNLYHSSKCRPWYSGANNSSGPFQDGQYDILIYTKNLRKDHGGQPRLAVTFGRTTSIKFLSISGVSTFATHSIDNNKINSYLNVDSFSPSNVSIENATGDLVHYTYDNLIPCYYMSRGYVHARRRGGVHPGGNKGSHLLGKYVLMIEDLLSRQRIEMVTPQLFSNGNPLNGLHGSGWPFQQYGQPPEPRNYSYNPITDGNITQMINTQSVAADTTQAQPLHYLILGNALNPTDQQANAGLVYEDETRVIDRAYRPILLRTDALSSSKFKRIVGLMQTGFPGINADELKEEFSELEDHGTMTNNLWLDLGETFAQQQSDLFKLVVGSAHGKQTGASSGAIKLEDAAISWSDSKEYKTQTIVKLSSGDYWEKTTTSSTNPWFHDQNYSIDDIIYCWEGASKVYYKCIKQNAGFSPKQAYHFFRAKKASQDKNPLEHPGLWSKLVLVDDNLAWINTSVTSITTYTSFRVLANSNSWPTSGRSAVTLGFGWKRAVSEEGIINKIAENNTETNLPSWVQGGNYSPGDLVVVTSGPVKVLSPDGTYKTYEEWIRTFGLEEQSGYSEQELSLLFSTAEAETPVHVYKCLKNTSDVDLENPEDYAGIIPGYIDSSVGSKNYKFVSNVQESNQRFDQLINQNIISQTIWKQITQAEFNQGQLDTGHTNIDYYGIDGNSINKKDVYGSGNCSYDLAFENYYEIGDAVKMGDDFFVKIKMFCLVEEVPSGYDLEDPVIDFDTIIKTESQKAVYNYNINLELSGPANYSTSSTVHSLIRTKWWQPIAKRTGELKKLYGSDNQSNTYFVSPRSFDYLYLNDGVYEQTDQTVLSSQIKVYSDEVKTFDVRGEAFYWSSNVKNITSSMINALDISDSNPELNLENLRVTSIYHPYISQAEFGVNWVTGKGLTANHPLVSNNAHPAVEYFKSWLDSNFDVDFTRDFASGNPSIVDEKLSDKFNLQKLFEKYNPTVKFKYTVLDESGNQVGQADRQYNGETIEISKDESLEITPELEEENGTLITSYSAILNSISSGNVIGEYLRSPREDYQKSISFDLLFTNLSISNPPVDADGLRIPFFTMSEATSGNQDTTSFAANAVTWSEDGEYSRYSIVEYGGNYYELSAGKTELFKNTPNRAVNHYRLLSHNNPTNNFQNNNETEDGVIFAAELSSGDSGFVKYDKNTDYNEPITAPDDVPPFSSEGSIINSGVDLNLFSNSNIFVGGDSQVDLQGEYSQVYTEISTKDTLLSRFKKLNNFYDQISDHSDLFRSSPKWKDVDGPGSDSQTGDLLNLEWSPSEVYSKGDIVTYQNKIYISKELNNNLNPALEPPEWSIVQHYHESSHYSAGDYIYIYQEILELIDEEEGISQSNIQKYGPSEYSGPNEFYPSLSKRKSYKIGEKIVFDNKIYECHTEGSVQAEPDLLLVFNLVSNYSGEPDHGGDIVFFVCQKDLQPGDGGHNPRKVSLLAGMHGDDDVLIRTNDNISKIYNYDEKIQLNFEYQNDGQFSESEKTICISVFGNTESTLLQNIVDEPEITDSHPSLISGYSINSIGEGLVSSGVISFKVKVNNPDPTAVSEIPFEGLNQSEKTSSKFASSGASMFCKNRFIINNNKLYASGLDSSEFGFIGLLEDTSDLKIDLDEYGDESVAYNKMYPFDQISNQEVKIFEENDGDFDYSNATEEASVSGVTMVDSEGGNTVFIFNNKLYGFGHNQGYSLGLCADANDNFGIGQRASSLSLQEKSSEATQDMMEAFLHFDAEYYLKLQATGSDYNLGDERGVFADDQSKVLMAWKYFKNFGFYKSLPAEYELICHSVINSSQISNPYNGYISNLNWSFTDQYNSSKSWIAQSGVMSTVSAYAPPYKPSEFWQTGGLHAFNIDQKYAPTDSNQMVIGDIDAYQEVSIFENFKRLNNKTSDKSEYIETIKSNAAQFKFLSDKVSTVDLSFGGSEPSIGWNGILVSEDALNQNHPNFSSSIINPASQTPATSLSRFKIGDLIGASSLDSFGTTTNFRSFYNTNLIYSNEDPNNQIMPKETLYVQGKPFWDPIIGCPDHVVFDFVSGEYPEGSDDSKDNVLGLYKLVSESNITFGNYPRFSKSLEISNLAGGERWQDGLSGNIKSVIPARTYVPRATKLTDEDVTWASTNKYSTFYINSSGQVKALGSVCACPAFEIQGFDDSDLSSEGNLNLNSEIDIQNFDSFGNLRLSPDPYVYSNDAWGLVYSEKGTVDSSNLQNKSDILSGESKIAGKDNSIYNFFNPLDGSFITSAPLESDVTTHNGIEVNQFGIYSPTSVFHVPWFSGVNSDATVDAVYRLILNRASDTAGEAYYTARGYLTVYELVQHIIDEGINHGGEYDPSIHGEDPTPASVKRDFEFLKTFGNTGISYASSTPAKHLIQISPDFFGAVNIENCERQEVNGTYRMATAFNDLNQWYNHPFNSDARSEGYGIWVSEKDTAYGKILIFFDAAFKLWRMQYSDFYVQETFSSGADPKIELLIAMQYHYEDANAADGTGYTKTSKANNKTPADVDSWVVGTGAWLNQDVEEGGEAQDPVVVSNTQHTFYDSTRVSWPARRFYSAYNWNTTQHAHLTIFPIPLDATVTNPSFTFGTDGHTNLFSPDGVSHYFNRRDWQGARPVEIIRNYTFPTEAINLVSSESLRDALALQNFNVAEDDDEYYHKGTVHSNFSGDAVSMPGEHLIVDDSFEIVGALDNDGSKQIDVNTVVDITIPTGDQAGNTRTWIPAHWGDKFNIKNDSNSNLPAWPGYRTEGGIIYGNGGWNYIPEDVDFVTEFSGNNIASGALGHYRGGAVREAFSMLSPFDTVPTGSRDSLDVWRYNLNVEAESITFKVKFTKKPGNFNSTGVAFGFYIFQDAGYKPLYMTDVDALFSTWPLTHKYPGDPLFLDFSRSAFMYGFSSIGAYLSDDTPGFGGIETPGFAGFPGAGSLPIIYNGNPLEIGLVDNFVGDGYNTVSASGAMLPTGTADFHFQDDSQRKTVPDVYVQNGEFVTLGGTRFYYFNPNFAPSSGRDFMHDNKFDADARQYAFLQRFFRWDNYIYEAYDDNGTFTFSGPNRDLIINSSGLTGSRPENFSADQWGIASDHILNRDENRIIGFGVQGYGAAITLYNASLIDGFPSAPGAELTSDAQFERHDAFHVNSHFGSGSSHNFGSYADFDENGELEMEITLLFNDTLNYSASNSIPPQGFFVVPVAEHLDTVSEIDLNLLNEEYEITASVTPFVEVFDEPMFLSSCTTLHVVTQDPVTNAPLTQVQAAEKNITPQSFSLESGGVSQYYSSITGLDASPFDYEISETYIQSDFTERFLSAGFPKKSWVNYFLGELTDWNFYFDNQPGLESQLSAQYPGVPLALLGLYDWNSQMFWNQRVEKSQYLQAGGSQRIKSSASYYRGIDSMRHNADWFYDDIFGWTTKSNGTHEPPSNLKQYSDSEWYFTTKYNCWFEVKSDQKTRRDNGSSFDVFLLNYGFNLIQHSPGSIPYNNDGLVSFDSFGEVLVGEIQIDQTYNQLDSYVYNNGDVVKIELAESEKLYRTLYFVSLKDNNTEEVGFIGSLSQVDEKKIKVPAPKGITKRYSITKQNTSSDSNLDGSLVVYDPSEYGGDKAKSVELGDSHALILTESGKVFGVGDNSFKQIDKKFTRNDNFNGLIQDDLYGRSVNNDILYLECIQNNAQSPFDQKSHWKQIPKPVWPVNAWKQSSTYSVGDKVFVRNETFFSILYLPQGNTNVKVTDKVIGSKWLDLGFWTEMEATFENSNRYAMSSEVVCARTIGEMFEREWAPGYSSSPPFDNSFYNVIIFAGKKDLIHHTKGMKSQHRYSYGDSFFITDRCYLNPHQIFNFESVSAVQNVRISAIDASGKGSIFLDSSNNLYGIGNNEISCSKKGEYLSDNPLGTVFGFRSEFLEGPSFIADGVTFMSKVGDCVSFISGGKSYRAGGVGLNPYFENYQELGAPALILDNDGTEIKAKTVFVESVDFWDKEDWFMERFLSQKFKNKFYLKGEKYKEMSESRISLNSRVGQYTSHTYNTPEINSFIEPYDSAKNYQAHIKSGQIYDAETETYIQTERPELSSGRDSAIKFNALPSAFESTVPSLVTYENKIYKCIQNNGADNFSNEVNSLFMKNRRCRNWQSSFTEDNMVFIPGQAGSELYWEEVSDLQNKNIIQTIVEKLNLFSFSSMIYVDSNNKLNIRGYNFGYTSGTGGVMSGLKDNSALIANERGSELGVRSPESQNIIRKHAGVKAFNYDLTNAVRLQNPFHVSSLYLDLQQGFVRDWVHPDPVGVEFNQTISGGRSLNCVDFLGFNRARGRYLFAFENSSQAFVGQTWSGGYDYNEGEYVFDEGQVYRAKVEIAGEAFNSQSPADDTNRWEQLTGTLRQTEIEAATNMDIGDYSNLNFVSQNTVYGSLNFADFQLLANNWKPHVSSHAPTGRILDRELSNSSSFGRKNTLFNGELYYSWPVLDPFAPSFMQGLGAKYATPLTQRFVIGHYTPANYAGIDRLDIGLIDFSSNPYGHKTGLESLRDNVYSWLNFEHSTEYPALIPAALRTPVKGLLSWWDLVKDVSKKLKYSKNIDTSIQDHQAFSEFTFMENYYGVENSNTFPLSDKTHFEAKPHISESAAPWQNRDNTQYYNPWSESNNFIQYAAKQENWSVFTSLTTYDMKNFDNIYGGNVNSNMLAGFLNDSQILNPSNFEDSIWDEWFSSQINEDDFSGLTDAFKELTIFDLNSHDKFLLGSYMLDPASLPFGESIPRWGYGFESDKIVSKSEYNIGERVFHKGFCFVSTVNSNSLEPVVSNSRDAGIDENGWNAIEPEELHRFRSQIGTAHQVTSAKLNSNSIVDGDPYLRQEYIPQQTIGHSQIDFSFARKSDLTNFHKIKDFDLFDRAEWNKANQNNETPADLMPHETHPIVEAENTRAEPLSAQAKNIKGIDYPFWYAVKSQAQSAAYNSYFDNYWSNFQGYSGFSQQKFHYMHSLGRFYHVLGYYDEYHTNATGDSGYERKSKSEIPAGDNTQPDDSPVFWIFNFRVPTNIPNYIQNYEYTFANGTKISVNPRFAVRTSAQIQAMKNQIDANGVESILDESGNVLTDPEEIANNIPIEIFYHVRDMVQTSPTLQAVKNVKYKFPKPAFPNPFGQVTDYMEAVSEMHNFGFSNFTKGSDASTDIWGREINQDFYCSPKFSTDYYNQLKENYYIDRSPTGISNVYCENTMTESNISTWKNDSAISLYSIDASGDLSFTKQDDIIQVPNGAFYLPNRNKMHVESTGLLLTKEEKDHSQILYKYTNSAGNLVVSAVLYGPELYYRGGEFRSNFEFVKGKVYLVLGGLYVCLQSWDVVSMHGNNDVRFPFLGKNDYMEFLGDIYANSVSIQSEDVYSQSADGKLALVSDKKFNYFEDFAHAIRNRRHLRFELRKIWSMETNVNNQSMNYIDSGTTYRHQGFINPSDTSSDKYAYVLEGGFAGIAMSDYFDIFKDTYSNKINKSYTDSESHNTTSLATTFQVGLHHKHHQISKDQAKLLAEKHIINLAKKREGLDYVWYDARKCKWIAGRNWLQESVAGEYSSEDLARSAAQNAGLSDNDLFEWGVECYPDIYKNDDGSVNRSMDKWIEHDVIYIGGKKHHQCLARIHGVIEKWKSEIDNKFPGILKVKNGGLALALLGSMINIKDWHNTNIEIDIAQ